MTNFTLQWLRAQHCCIWILKFIYQHFIFHSTILEYICDLYGNLKKRFLSEKLFDMIFKKINLIWILGRINQDSPGGDTILQCIIPFEKKWYIERTFSNDDDGFQSGFEKCDTVLKSLILGNGLCVRFFFLSINRLGKKDSSRVVV